MPAIQDKERKTWTAQFYYTDYNGNHKRKRKRGFKYKRDALQWEREFLLEHENELHMPFSQFVQIYLDDCKNRLRTSTCEIKEFLLNSKIIPYFGEMRLCEITPLHVRDWQNELLAYRDETGKAYSQSYLKAINNLLFAVFSFAVRIYGLNRNPCLEAGTIGSAKTKEIKIWTAKEFDLFLKTMGKSNPPHRLAFITLFYSGLRIGELLALTSSDIDMKTSTISVTKTYRRHNKQDLITPPKTEKSIREVAIPAFLRDELKAFIENSNIGQNDRIFPFTSDALRYTLNLFAEKAGLPRIRIHDFRHCHASLLINMGFSPSLVADRLGHNRVRTTLNIYTHIYGYTRDEIADKLNDLAPRFL